jgi:hypothetical protein
LVRAVAGIENNLNQIARNVSGVVEVGALNQLDAFTIIYLSGATERTFNAVHGYLES